MDTNITSTIVDDTLVNDTVATEETPSELYRRVALPIQARVRRMEFENAKALKKNYLDWVFNKLNLQRFN